MSSSNGELRQVMATLIINILSINQGMLLGWAAPSMKFFESSLSDLYNGPLTEHEVDIIDSMHPLGGLIGSLTFPLIMKPFGTKINSRVTAVLQILSCSLKYFASGPVVILVARFLGGLSAAYCLMLIPIFTAEISEPTIRGFLGMFLMFAAGLGVVVAYCLGALMRYDLCLGICILFSIMFLILSLRLRETPFSLLKHDRINDAKDAMKYYRGLSSEERFDENTTIEFENMKRFVIGTSTTSFSFKKRLAEFCDSKAARKSLVFGLIMIGLEEFCGCFVLLFNVTAFLEKSGAIAIPSSVSTIGVGVAQLIGAYLAMFTVDRMGRKILYTISAFGIAFCMLVSGIATQIIVSGGSEYTSMDDEGWQLHDLSDSTFIKMLPVVAVIASVFLANIGLFSLSFVILAEISPEHVIDEIFMICTTFSFVLRFSVLHLHTLVSDTFGNGGMMFFFAFNSALGGFFSTFHLPETKGKTFEEISKMMSS